MQKPDIPHDAKRHIDIAKEKIEKAIQDYRIAGKGIVEVSEQNQLPHYAIAESLRCFLYKKKKQDLAAITFSYTDGGDARDLVNLYSVERRRFQSHQHRATPLRVSLISMRHLAMDHIVDMAWLLNKEVRALGTTYADRDHYCYERAQAFLSSLARKDIRNIHLFQTGYPPAIIGFYRALIEHLRIDEFAITPYYFDPARKYYWEGEQWS